MHREHAREEKRAPLLQAQKISLQGEIDNITRSIKELLEQKEKLEKDSELIVVYDMQIEALADQERGLQQQLLLLEPISQPNTPTRAAATQKRIDMLQKQLEVNANALEKTQKRITELEVEIASTQTLLMEDSKEEERAQIIKDELYAANVQRVEELEILHSSFQPLEKTIVMIKAEIEELEKQSIDSTLLDAKTPIRNSSIPSYGAVAMFPLPRPAVSVDEALSDVDETTAPSASADGPT